MSAYEKLVDRVAESIWLAEPRRIGSRRRTKWSEESEETHSHYYPLAAASIAEVLNTLETLTPEMVAAWDDESSCAIYEEYAASNEEYAASNWYAMLYASPLIEGL